MSTDQWLIDSEGLIGKSTMDRARIAGYTISTLLSDTNNLVLLGVNTDTFDSIYEVYNNHGVVYIQTKSDHVPKYVFNTLGQLETVSSAFKADWNIPYYDTDNQVMFQGKKYALPSIISYDSLKNYPIQVLQLLGLEQWVTSGNPPDLGVHNYSTQGEDWVKTLQDEMQVFKTTMENITSKLTGININVPDTVALDTSSMPSSFVPDWSGLKNIFDAYLSNSNGATTKYFEDLLKRFTEVMNVPQKNLTSIGENIVNSTTNVLANPSDEESNDFFEKLMEIGVQGGMGYAASRAAFNMFKTEIPIPVTNLPKDYFNLDYTGDAEYLGANYPFGTYTENPKYLGYDKNYAYEANAFGGVGGGKQESWLPYEDYTRKLYESDFAAQLSTFRTIMNTANLAANQKMSWQGAFTEGKTKSGKYKYSRYPKKGFIKSKYGNYYIQGS